VLIPAIAGAASIWIWGDTFIPVFLLAPGIMMGAGFLTFVLENRKLKRFALEPTAIRELEMSAEPEKLPRFTWLGLVPFAVLAASALYLSAHWDQMPAERTFRGVYGPLILSAEMTLWLFGFALAVWYGSRRSETLRRPAFAVFLILEWMPALLMPAMPLKSLVSLPPGILMALPMVVILASVVYLVQKSRAAKGPLDPTPNECWKGGILYYNPNDPVLFVARRDGAGFTLNMGNPWSWAVIGSPLLMALSSFVVMPH
jgi:hypothetical protein